MRDTQRDSHAIPKMADLQAIAKRRNGPGRYGFKCISKRDARGLETFDARRFDATADTLRFMPVSKMLARWRRAAPDVGFRLVMFIYLQVNRKGGNYNMLVDAGCELRALEGGVFMTDGHGEKLS